MLVLQKKVRVDAFFVHGFSKLRAQDGIERDWIEHSLCPIQNRKQVFKAGEASGASGSFFFFTHDKSFVIKTMTSSEKKFFFSKFGKSYFQYLQSNPSSYIARIYGIYTVTMQGHAPIHLMMLAHTLKIPRMERVLRIYDLKGSTVNRKVKVKKGGSRTQTLKDLNFMQLKKAEPLDLIEIDQAFVLKQLQRDTEFLKSQSIMDYSLLFAVEKADVEARQSINSRDKDDNAKSPSSRHRSGKSANTPNSSNNRRLELLEASLNKNPYELESQSGRVKYHLAIIDYLQEWNANKKLERLLKVNLRNADPQGLSAIEPDSY